MGSYGPLSGFGCIITPELGQESMVGLGQGLGFRVASTLQMIALSVTILSK